MAIALVIITLIVCITVNNMFINYLEIKYKRREKERDQES